eukprot:gene12607-15833_t
MADYSQYMKVATEAAKAAAEVIKAGFSAPKSVEHKGAVDLVTETDKMAESLVKSIIHEAFPKHLFIGEEASADQGYADAITDEPTWMCDPLDGTTNFVHSFPFVVVGVVLNPILGELFTASLGGGAQLNGIPIDCSDCSDLGKALVATEVGTTRDEATMDAIFDRIRSLANNVRSLRCCGSCAMNLCGVACGRLDAFYEVGFGGCWDVAAGALIVTEAGGRVLDPAGGPFNVMGRRVLGTNSQLADPITSILKHCKTSIHRKCATSTPDNDWSHSDYTLHEYL